VGSSDSSSATTSEPRTDRKRLAQLLQSAQDIANSSEFQALRASLMALAQQTLGQLQQNVTPQARSSDQRGRRVEGDLGVRRSSAACSRRAPRCSRA
jgi:hypothetical protein